MYIFDTNSSTKTDPSSNNVKLESLQSGIQNVVTFTEKICNITFKTVIYLIP